MVKLLKSKLVTSSFLFVFGVVYFSIFGKHVILYQNDQHLFLYTYSYLRLFFNMPGGFTEWLSGFFTQFYFYPALGAVVISSLMLLVWIISKSLFSKLGLKYDFGLPVVIYGAIFGVVQFFENSIIPVIAVLINLSSLLILLRIKIVWIRYFLEVLFAVTLYETTGAFYAIFIAISLLSELILFDGKWRFVNAITIFTLGIYTPYFLSIHFYYLFAPVAYKYPVVNGSHFYGYELAVIVSVLVILVSLAGFREMFDKRIVMVEKVSNYLNLFFIAVFVVYVFNNYNPSIAKLVTFSQIGKAAAAENSYSVEPSPLWDDILELAAYEKGNGLYPFYTNIALSYKGLLLDDILKYDNHKGVLGLYYPWVGNSHLREHGGAFYYSVGFVNEAHHWAYESMIHTGPVAPLLKQLAVYNIVMGKITGAKKYLSVLQQTLFYRSWANRFIKLTNDTTTLNSLDWVVKKREQIPAGDFFMDLKGLNRNLENSVKANPANKVAFDYLIAFYLLDGRPDKIMDYYNYINDFYNSCPHTVEEALILLPDYTVEFENVHNEFIKYVSDRDKMMKSQLSNARFDQHYSKTYWYYIDFLSPHHKLKK